MLENRYKEIFDKAKAAGVTKREIGRRLFSSRSTGPWIYKIGAVTKYEQYTYDRLNKTLEEIIKEREENAQKN